MLTEEVGEVARAIQDEDDAALRKELAQVAAMACRFAVSIPAGRVRPPWGAKGATPASALKAIRSVTRSDPWAGVCGFHYAPEDA